MDRDETARAKALKNTAIGGVCGLAAAAAAAAIIMLIMSGGAWGQTQRSGNPAIETARADCESGAREGVLTGRALGACDMLLRSPETGESERARVLVNRAVIFLGRNQPRQAREDLEAAVELAPDLAEAWLSLSAARIRTGSAGQALDAASRARDLGAPPAMTAFNTGIALETLGRFEEAYDAYAEAARLDPDNALFQAQPARFMWHQPS